MNLPLWIHLANGALVYGAGALLKLGPRAAGLSAAVYLSLFLHFPAAAGAPGQAGPPVLLFFSLLAFLAVLRTARGRGEGRPHRMLFGATVVLGGILTLPFAMTLSAFLQPIRAAMGLDSTRPFHLLRPLWEFSDLLFAAAVLGLFLFAMARKRRQAMWVIWTAAAGWFPSGKLVYCSPAFAWILGSVAALLASVWGCRAGRTRLRGLLLWVGVAALCLENLAAIRLTAWRGRLANGAPEISAQSFPNAWYPKRLDSFLLAYLLPSSCRLEDVRWITQGLPLRSWLKKMGMPPEREAELDDDLANGALRLFHLSYLESKAGNVEGGRYWLSQIRFLEEDPKAAKEWIGKRPQVLADASLKGYLVRFDDPGFFSEPLPWRKDDYGFGRFLARFFLRVDVRSGWDRRTPSAIISEQGGL